MTNLHHGSMLVDDHRSSMLREARLRRLRRRPRHPAGRPTVTAGPHPRPTVRSPRCSRSDRPIPTPGRPVRSADAVPACRSEPGDGGTGRSAHPWGAAHGGTHRPHPAPPGCTCRTSSAKLGMSSRTEAAAWAVRSGIGVT